jgi:hypothetical protein
MKLLQLLLQFTATSHSMRADPSNPFLEGGEGGKEAPPSFDRKKSSRAVGGQPPPPKTVSQPAPPAPRPPGFGFANGGVAAVNTQPEVLEPKLDLQVMNTGMCTCICTCMCVCMSVYACMCVTSDSVHICTGDPKCSHCQFGGVGPFAGQASTKTGFLRH